MNRTIIELQKGYLLDLFLYYFMIKIGTCSWKYDSWRGIVDHDKYKDLIKGTTIIRLHGSGRSGIEKISGQNWNQIYINRDKGIKQIVDMIQDLQTGNIGIYRNIYNHYEGCAPLTIQKITELLKLK